MSNLPYASGLGSLGLCTVFFIHLLSKEADKEALKFKSSRNGI